MCEAKPGPRCTPHAAESYSKALAAFDSEPGEGAATSEPSPLDRIVAQDRTATDPTPAAREYVDPCPGMKGEDVITSECGRCFGQGVVNYGNVQLAKHLSNGAVVKDRYCFECGGSGTISRKVKNIRAAARREIKAAVEREQKAAARRTKAEQERERQDAELRARREQYEAERPDVVDAVYKVRGEFGESMREVLATQGALTDKQAETVLRIATEQAGEVNDPPPAPVVVGKGVTVTGRVVSEPKWKSNPYGPGGALKMTVLDDRGFKVWGTVPESLQSIDTWDETTATETKRRGVQKGDRITFTATTEASDGDETFGFFKRPTQATFEVEPERATKAYPPVDAPAAG